MKFLISTALSISRIASSYINFIERWITPAFNLILRLYVSSVFFRSGWLKLSDWETTKLLFANDYHVPLLPPGMAAVCGTFGELCLPILLVVGLAGRFGAAGLFVVNLVAAISFSDLSDLGLQDHILWGVMLLMIFLHGPGRFSLDQWLVRRTMKS